MKTFPGFPSPGVPLGKMQGSGRELYERVLLTGQLILYPAGPAGPFSPCASEMVLGEFGPHSHHARAPATGST